MPARARVLTDRSTARRPKGWGWGFDLAARSCGLPASGVSFSLARQVAASSVTGTVRNGLRKRRGGGAGSVAAKRHGLPCVTGWGNGGFPLCRDHRDRLATGRRLGAGPPQVGRSAWTIGTGWQRAAGLAQDRRRWAGVPGPSGQVGNGPQGWRRTAAGGPECRDHRDRLQRAAGLAQDRRRWAGVPGPSGQAATGRRIGAGPP